MVANRNSRTSSLYIIISTNRHNKPLFGSYYTVVAKTYAITYATTQCFTDNFSLWKRLFKFKKMLQHVSNNAVKCKNDQYNIAVMYENDQPVRAK